MQRQLGACHYNGPKWHAYGQRPGTGEEAAKLRFDLTLDFGVSKGMNREGDKPTGSRVQVKQN